MREKITSEVISRRRVLSLGLVAALSLAAPTTVLTVSDAEAQQAPPSPPPAGELPAAQPGERRTRRKRRRERREERRARRERRHERRRERREERRTRRDHVNEYFGRS